MDFEYIYMKHKIDAEIYEKKTGRWKVVNLRRNTGWPGSKKLIKFRNHFLLLLPEDEKLYSAVAVMLDSSLDENKARLLILHFLSSLAWVDLNKIEIEGWSGGGFPHRLNKNGSSTIINPISHIFYLPDPNDSKTRLAFAFYREALALNHVAYSFFSYFKIINLIRSTGPKQKSWIKNNLAFVDDWNAKKRINILLNDGHTVEEYLYNSCRCAIAHAGTNPTVDPENIADMNRLNADLPLIKNLVEILIEKEFAVKRKQTIWKEHFYELQGFKEKFGIDTILKIKENPSDITSIDLPTFISVRLWGERKFGALEKLTSQIIRIEQGFVILECSSNKNLVSITFKLDFEKKKLLFDPVRGINNEDDGSTLAAEFAADINDFLGQYYFNGILELWDAENDVYLGWCPPFIPKNIDLSETLKNFENRKIQCLAEAKARRKND